MAYRKEQGTVIETGACIERILWLTPEGVYVPHPTRGAWAPCGTYPARIDGQRPLVKRVGMIPMRGINTSRSGDLDAVTTLNAGSVILQDADGRMQSLSGFQLKKMETTVATDDTTASACEDGCTDCMECRKKKIKRGLGWVLLGVGILYGIWYYSIKR